jgi:hypothetical protein
LDPDLHARTPSLPPQLPPIDTTPFTLSTAPAYPRLSVAGPLASGPRNDIADIIKTHHPYTPKLNVSRGIEKPYLHTKIELLTSPQLEHYVCMFVAYARHLLHWMNGHQNMGTQAKVTDNVRKEFNGCLDSIEALVTELRDVRGIAVAAEMENMTSASPGAAGLQAV